MFVLQAALGDLISPNISEGEGCAGSAGDGRQTPRPWKEGDGVEAQDLRKLMGRERPQGPGVLVAVLCCWR